MARLYVGVTDYDWYEHLHSIDNIEEVNFWQPSGSRGFSVLGIGELFLFKLHAPRNAIVGGGFFARHTTLPVHLAWQFFGKSNGAVSEEQMIRRVLRYVPEVREASLVRRESHNVGCILLQQPFFFREDEWMPQPSDWAPNIVQGRSYDLGEVTGAGLLQAVSERLRGVAIRMAEEASGRYGSPSLVRHRLGQGSFRAAVTDAYSRQCAVTGDRVLYVLNAAHIRPYAMGGEHSVDNGLLLRSDLHTLFDRGYLTVTREHRLQVSRRLREEFSNGKEYYALDGRPLLVPQDAWDVPDGELLEWHRREVFDAA